MIWETGIDDVYDKIIIIVVKEIKFVKLQLFYLMNKYKKIKLLNVCSRALNMLN